MRLTTNRAYKVSQIFGKLSDHCVPDGAFKRLLKKYPALSESAQSSGAGPGPMNETKLIALNCSSFAGGADQKKPPKPGLQKIEYIFVLKSHITEAMFPAYLNVLLVICSLQKPSKGKHVFFPDEVVHQGHLVIFETCMNS